jgi:hypothetical protein
VVDNLTNSGTLTINGNGIITVGDNWINDGVFNPGTSTTTISSDTDITISGGNSFYNLVIDAVGTGSGVKFSTSSAMVILNDFTIVDGEFEVADANHTITIGGHLVVDDTNATFTDNLSTITFNGNNQNIGSASEVATINFNNLILGGTGTKTMEDKLILAGNLSVVSGVTLAMQSQILDFSGASFDIDGSLTTSGASTVNFKGSQVQIITGDVGGITLDNLGIDNSAIGNNDVQLNISVSVAVKADFVDGVVQSSASNALIFNDNATVSYDGVSEVAPMGITNDGSSYAVGPVVKIGDDNFIFPIGQGSRQARLGISGFLGTVTAADRFSAEYFYAADGNVGATKNGSIKRVSGIESWDLSNLNAHGSQPLVTLFWDASSGVNSQEKLLVAHYNSATTSWDDQGKGAVSGTATSGSILSAVQLTSFSPIVMATSQDDVNPLPVEMVYFAGNVDGEEVNLEWQTATEIDNDYFEIQRSIDGIEFKVIGTVDGNGTSKDIHNYSFSDNGAICGINYYRLKQIDFDGQFEFSELLDIRLVCNNGAPVFEVFPNPAPAGRFVLNYEGSENQEIHLKLVDQVGVVQATKVVVGVKGSVEFQPNQAIAKGLYYLIIESSGTKQVKKILIN